MGSLLSRGQQRRQEVDPEEVDTLLPTGQRWREEPELHQVAGVERARGWLLSTEQRWRELYPVAGVERAKEWMLPTERRRWEEMDPVAGVELLRLPEVRRGTEEPDRDRDPELGETGRGQELDQASGVGRARAWLRSTEQRWREVLDPLAGVERARDWLLSTEQQWRELMHPEAGVERARLSEVRRGTEETARDRDPELGETGRGQELNSDSSCALLLLLLGGGYLVLTYPLACLELVLGAVGALLLYELFPLALATLVNLLPPHYCPGVLSRWLQEKLRQQLGDEAGVAPEAARDVDGEPGRRAHVQVRSRSLPACHLE